MTKKYLQNKRNKIIEWILPITSTIIASILVTIFIGLYSHVRKSEAMDVKILVRQAELQKDIGENYLRSKKNREIGIQRYSEIKDQMNEIKILFTKLKSNQNHILKEIKKKETK